MKKILESILTKSMCFTHTELEERKITEPHANHFTKLEQ